MIQLKLRLFGSELLISFCLLLVFTSRLTLVSFDYSVVFFSSSELSKKKNCPDITMHIVQTWVQSAAASR